MLSGIASGETLSLKYFYVRRALRTFPAFWFVLALYFLFPTVMGGAPPPPLWRFLTFTQNLGLQAGTAFSHAWSLCIEEQFYLVLPLVVAAGIRSTTLRARGWTLLFALLAVGVTARVVLWYKYGEKDYSAYIYYSTLCRFDEFLPGVAVAMLKNFHRPVWERITRHGQRTFALGALATASMLYAVYHGHFTDDYAYRSFIVCLGFSLIAIAFAILVVAALSPGSWLHRVRIPGAYHIALWSYSIYLSHKAMAFIANTQPAQRAFPPGIKPLIIACACLAAGWLLYRLVEAPFMAIRARRFPTSFASAVPMQRSATAPLNLSE
jgi:peptidoglycan/LPS O-acetylase OafA/YrhL